MSEAWRDGLTLRLAVEDDVPGLAALYARTAAELGPQVYNTQQVKAWQRFGQDTPAFRHYVLSARTWWLADPRGALGFCGIDDEGEVHSLYVRFDAGQRGLGTRLLDHALADARSRGVVRFGAWATPFSLPVFARAGLALRRTVRESFQGIEFERYRVATD